MPLFLRRIEVINEKDNVKRGRGRPDEGRVHLTTTVSPETKEMLRVLSFETRIPVGRMLDIWAKEAMQGEGKELLELNK